MKINLYFKLENSVIPISYQKYIVSFIKMCLEKYDEELYKKWYKGNTEIKPFTFSVYFTKPEFKEDKIILGGKHIEVYFKMPISEEAIRLYNAFLMEYKEPDPFKITGNTMQLANVYSERLKEFQDEHLIIKMNSPLIARYHNHETNEDKYYLATDYEFEEIVKMNISNVIKHLNLKFDLSNFEIKPLKTSKCVIALYDTTVEGSLGIFEIKGNKELLNFLNQAGIGSIRSSGFGSISVLK